ncbi:MAG: fibronectin type III domain-containing protein [Actinomycetota bacterium]|nr:fibronectin type III domain-containing protein [Actinomycetota bacterium]
MSQPANGVSFKAAGHAYLNSLLVRRGGRWTLAVRDYGGSATNLSPGSSFGAPMALDGTWRDDMYAIVKNAAGQWVYNLKPNLGFYPYGFVHPDGFERAPKIDSDPLEGLQSLDPIRVDMQKRDKTLMFTPMERNLVADAIQFNLPLTGVLERAADTDNTYFVGESTDDEPLRRQAILMHEDKQGGLVARSAFPFPRCVLTDQGSTKGNKKDQDTAKVTLSREIDPFFVDAFGVPLLDGRWDSGSIHDQNIVPGLTFLPTAPVGTPTAATTATIVLPVPIGGVSPYTYATAKSAASTMTSPSAPSGGAAPAVANGLLTFSLTGLTTATTSYYQVTVTDDDGNTAKSAIVSITQP